jgi:Retinal pigment epithelial membrane protein
MARRAIENRYVLTKGLAAEMKAGRALWGGVMTPAAPPAALAGPDPDPGGDKVLPDINIVRHAHMFLALGEGVAPYEVTPELVTVGRYDSFARLCHLRNRLSLVRRLDLNGLPASEFATVVLRVAMQPPGTVEVRRIFAECEEDHTLRRVARCKSPLPSLHNLKESIVMKSPKNPKSAPQKEDPTTKSKDELGEDELNKVTGGKIGSATGGAGAGKIKFNEF